MIETLQTIGLNKNESECYIALLELGSTRTGPLVKKTKIPSSKIYIILERLIEKGLASYIIKENIKQYQATDPKVLINILEEKKKELEEVMPKLLLKQKMAKKQSVEMFEGKKAIMTMFTSIIEDGRKGEEYLVFSIDDECKDEEINRFLRTLTLKRKEKELDVKLLKNKKHYKREEHGKLKLKYTDFNLPQGITIFKNSVILLTWSKNTTAIKIDSQDYAQQMRTFFLELWKKAKN